MSNVIKCLMIGQHGTGKSTYLSNFPNSKNLTESSNTPKGSKEIFSIEYINNRFETIKIEIDNCDISLETCLHDTDLVVNNKIIPATNQFINITQYKIIIMCFALDDPSSFELIKSKWEIDLKRNKSERHAFILLGMKSDLVTTAKSSKNETDKKLVETVKPEKVKKSKQKKRSSSVNSVSSTSRLKKRERVISELDSAAHKLPLSKCKKFAKQIGSINLILVSSPNTNLNAYEKFLNNISKKSDMADKKESTLVKKSNKLKVSKLPKSISAPINLLMMKKMSSNNKIKINNNAEDCDNSLDNFSLKNGHENTSFIENHQRQSKADESSKPVSNNLENNSGKQEEQNMTTTNDLSIKDKLSRFAIGIGTYIVTCGSTRTRKLADLKKLKNEHTFEIESSSSTVTRKNVSSKNVKKNKSWLLLASELSLNNTENDDVFS